MLNMTKFDIKHSLTILQRSKLDVESVNFVIGSTDNHSRHGHRMNGKPNTTRLCDKSVLTNFFEISS